MSATPVRALITQYADGQVVISRIRKKRSTIPIFGANEEYTATLVTTYYDGSAMDDSKADGSVYFKLKALPSGADPEIYGQYIGSYFRVSLPKFGETFLEKDTMAEMRDLSTIEVLLLKMGYYKGVKLNGYYDGKRYVNSLNYFLSESPILDDGGSIIQISDIKLECDFNGYVNIEYFGARGNWNNYTLTGSNDTEYYQNAVDYLNRFGTTRKGNPRIIFSPRGNYFLSHLLVKGFDDNNDNLFGLSIIGDSRGGTMFSFDDRDERVGLQCNEEAVNFSKIIFNGSRYFPPTGTPAEVQSLRKDIMLDFKKWSNHADVDVIFTDCMFSNYNRAINIHGRGLTFGGDCIAGKGDFFSNILCDTDIIFDNSSSTDPTGTQGTKTGYRNYNFNNIRSDGASVFINIEGAGAQKDYINGLVVKNNSFLVSDLLIKADDATLRAPLICNNDAKASFRGGVVQAKAVYNATDIGNIWSSKYDPDLVQTAVTDGMVYVYNCGEIHGLTFQSTVYRLNRNLIRVSVGGSNIQVTNSKFPKLFEFQGEASPFLISSPTKINGLVVTGNTFESNGVRTNYQVVSTQIQFPSNSYIFENNVSNFNWSGGNIQTFLPVIQANGVDSPTGLSNLSKFNFKIDSNYVKGDMQISYKPDVADTGALRLTVPIAGKSVNTGFTSSFCGALKVDSLINNNNLAISGTIEISGGTTYLNLKKYNDTTKRYDDLLVSDLDSTKSLIIFGSINYRYK